MDIAVRSERPPRNRLDFQASGALLAISRAPTTHAAAVDFEYRVPSHAIGNRLPAIAWIACRTRDSVEGLGGFRQVS